MHSFYMTSMIGPKDRLKRVSHMLSILYDVHGGGPGNRHPCS